MLRLRQWGPYDDKQLYANHNRSDHFCEQYKSRRSGSCGDGMQGEWGTPREKLGVDWSPCTWSDPAEHIDSPSHAPPLLSAHTYSLLYSFNALARPQMMSPFSTSHPCISALNVFIIETRNLIKFWIKSILSCCLCMDYNTRSLTALPPVGPRKNNENRRLRRWTCTTEQMSLQYIPKGHSFCQVWENARLWCHQDHLILGLEATNI